MISKIDKQKWQAEDDARIMATYQEILNDKGRMKRAIKAAEQSAKDLNKRAAAMNNVIKLKGGKSSKKS